MKNKNTLIRLMRFISPYKSYLIFALVFSAINIVFTLMTPVLIGRAIDTMIGKGKVNFSYLSIRIVQIIITVILAAITNYLVGRFSSKMTFEITKDLRDQLFAKYHALPLKYIDSHSHGDLMSRMIADIDLISDGLLQGFTNLFAGVATIIGTIGFMLAINIKIALIVIILTPISLIVSSQIATRVYKYFQKQLAIRGELSGYVEEMIGNQKVVKAFSHEEVNKAAFDEINQRLFVSGVKSQFLGALVNPSTRFVNAIVYAAVTIFGAFTVLNGGITVGALSSFLTYANQYTKPFNDISNVFTELETALACADRVFKIIDEDEIVEPINASTIEHPQGDIKIDSLQFSYVPEKPLIEDFHLDVKAGQTIAIVGPTGCGKTTLLSLMGGLEAPCDGYVEYAGENIGKKGFNNYRRYDIALIFQSYNLINYMNAYQNIVCAMDIAHIKEPNKKERALKILGKLGIHEQEAKRDIRKLSGGQQQRVAIARAMAKNAQVILADEPTGNLDNHTAQSIIQNFIDLAHQDHRLVIVVTHDQNFASQMDVCLKIEDGMLVEYMNKA